MPRIFSKKGGFSLLELLLTIAIFSIVSIGTGYLIIDAGTTTDVNNKKITATFLAKEGIEATRSIRDARGATSFNDILPDGNHGLAFNETDSTWSFFNSSDTSTDNIYNRVVNVSTVDTHIKKVTSTVTAVAGMRDISVSLVTYFTDWR